MDLFLFSTFIWWYLMRHAYTWERERREKERGRKGGRDGGRKNAKACIWTQKTTFRSQFSRSTYHRDAEIKVRLSSGWQKTPELSHLPLITPFWWYTYQWRCINYKYVENIPPWNLNRAWMKMAPLNRAKSFWSFYLRLGLWDSSL